jgi:folylpolyglutamate synthase
VPVVSFEQSPLAMEVIEKRAQEKNAPLTVLHAKDISKLEGINIGKTNSALNKENKFI